MFASFVLKVIISKGMFFDEIVFKVTSAMVMMLTKLSLFLEAVFSGCLCVSVRFVKKVFYCICFRRAGELLNVSPHYPHLYGFLCM